MQDYHAEFVEIYNKNITRPGADRLLNWLETTDFFTAPASTRFHGACECGLVMHSINVYNAMMQHFFTEGESAESYAICGLLHDLCKANFYKVGTRNVKNDVTGQWEKYSKEVLCLLKRIAPRKIKGYLHIGMEDPATTGQILGYYGMLYPLIGEHIDVVPDFEHVILEGTLKIRGNITLFQAVRIACTIYFDKDLQKLIRLLKREVA